MFCILWAMAPCTWIELFTISDSKNCRFCYGCSFYVLFLYDEPFLENENIFVLLMWEVCCPHYANIILDILWHLRYILYTYSFGVSCIVISSCLFFILTDFLQFI